MLSIIGCGNRNRSDDGVGCLVAEQLQEKIPAHHDAVKVFVAGTDGISVMFQARGCSQLIIIDASKSDSMPGTIYQVPGDVLENQKAPSYNLHDFRWDHAIFSGRKMYQQDFPKDVTVYLIEAQTLDYGFDLSDCVKEASDKVVNKILKTASHHLTKPK